MRKKKFAYKVLACSLIASMTLSGTTLTGFADVLTSAIVEVKRSTVSNADRVPIATDSNLIATMPNAMLKAGDIWTGLTMSDHLDGEGTEKSPYLIQTANDLRYLAYHTANEEVNGFQDVYFKVTRDISLSTSASWLPIGYYQALDDPDPVPFKGIFDGNGKTISNLQVNNTTQTFAGLFGVTQGATIKNIKLNARIAALDKAGGIVGEANDTVIQNCTVSGSIRANGILGGIAGEAYDSFLQNCTNHAQVTGGSAAAGLEVYAGGIAGSVHNSKISDCISDTTDNSSTIYSENAVGGIVGNVEASNIYNCYAEGKVGSSSAKIIGGIVGRLQSGEVKVNRFAGTIGASASGHLQEAGLFIGRIETGITELGSHISYLYCNSEDKFSINPFGNALNGLIRAEHHIGAYSADNRECSLYSPVTSPKFNKLTNTYFYEELENGVLSLADEDVRHWAPSKTGDPVQGYLVTVEDINNGNLSVQEAQNTYAKEINYANPGAVAKGVKVFVHTSPRNEASNPPVYYELVEDSLKWFIPGTGKYHIIDQSSSELSFTMPQDNIEITAEYQAMTNGVALDKTELLFEVTQIRTGSRWEPTIAWKLTDPQQLRATIIPDTAANKNVYWNVKDTDGSSTDVIEITDNGTVSVNKDAKWITDKIGAAVNNQLTLYPSKKITLQDSNFATATVTTEAGQKRASCMVRVNLSVDDETYVPVNNVQLNQSEISFDVEKVMTGNRLDPIITYKVTPGQRLFATITPDYSDNQDITWTAGNKDMASIDPDGLVSVNQSARWISDLIAADTAKLEHDKYAESTARGSQSTYVTATTIDGGKQAVCGVNIRFQTVDETIIRTEGVELDKKEIEFKITKTLSGNRLHPEINYEVTPVQLLTATVNPNVANNKKLYWEASDGNILSVGQNGTVEANRDAIWIQNLIALDEKKLKEDKYAVSDAAGETNTFVTVKTEDGDFKDICNVNLTFETIDETIIHVEGVELDKKELEFQITRKLSGNRLNPEINYEITSDQLLTATVGPDAAFNKNLVWETSDADAIMVNQDGTVAANQEAEWVKALIALDEEKLREDKYAACNAAGDKETNVTVRTENGNFEDVCQVSVKFATEDNTTIHVEGVELDKKELEFQITRVLSGNRLNPEINYEVTSSQLLTATVHPDVAFNKNLFWKSSDEDAITVSQDGTVTANQEAEWVKALVTLDEEKLKENKYAVCDASGDKEANVTVKTVDGNFEDVCQVSVKFATVDHTIIHVEGVSLDKKELEFKITRTLSGNRLQPEISYEVTTPQRLTATIDPTVAFNKNIQWESSNGNALKVDQTGLVSINQEAEWVKALIALDEEKLEKDKYAFSDGAGNEDVLITVKTEDGDFEDVCHAALTFETIDETIVYTEGVKLDKQELNLEIEMVKTGRRGNPKIEYLMTEAQRIEAAIFPTQALNKNMTWSANGDGVLLETKENHCLITANPEAVWIDNLLEEYKREGTEAFQVEVKTQDGEFTGTCLVTIAFKVTDKTISSSGGGGSGSGSGGGGSFSGSSAAGGPGGLVITGKWNQDKETLKWKYQKMDGTYLTNSWTKLPFYNGNEWYRFDKEGNMVTGWYLDTDGFTYFLHNVADGRQGYMYNGWHLIDGKWYYFNKISNGVRGSLLKNTITPDGYKVGVDGAWIPR